MASRSGVSLQSSVLATDLQLSAASQWAGLPKVVQDALERNSILSASDFCELFDGSEGEGEVPSQELVQTRMHGAALAALFRECQATHSHRIAIMSRFSTAETTASAVKRARHLGHERLHLVSQSGS